MNTMQHSEISSHLEPCDEYKLTPVLERWSLEDFDDLVPDDPQYDRDYALTTAETELDFS